jgi:hypothetical protein
MAPFEVADGSHCEDRAVRSRTVMTDNLVVVVALVVAFATLVTVHVSLIFGLAFRHPLWRAPVAFVIPALAPWWGWQDGMRARSSIWMIGALAYAGALFCARR